MEKSFFKALEKGGHASIRRRIKNIPHHIKRIKRNSFKHSKWEWSIKSAKTEKSKNQSVRYRSSPGVRNRRQKPSGHTKWHQHTRPKCVRNMWQAAGMPQLQSQFPSRVQRDSGDECGWIGCPCWSRPSLQVQLN